VHPLAERLSTHIRRQELLNAGDRVGVAVSGGIDSVALLRLLLELRWDLGIVLSVVHFNHKLRGTESDADERFVASLARAHDLQFHADSDDVAQYAAEEQISIETAARDLRYGFFRHLLGEDLERSPQGLKPSSLLAANGTAEGVPFHEPSSLCSESREEIGHQLDKLATGHTLDDQAETVLMRLIRGAGLRGLGGIHPRIPVEDDQEEICGEVIRPLLATRRRELQQYLNGIHQPWREDSSNADDHFTRNRVRKLVVPLLEKEFNPSVAENLAELAEIARGEEDYWDNEISGWLGTTVQWSEPDWARPANETDAVQPNLIQIGMGGIQKQRGLVDADLQARIDNALWLVVNASVSRMWFLGEPTAVQRRLVKAIGEHVKIPLEFKHIEEALRFAEEGGASGKELSLPLGWKLVREPDQLTFLTPDLREPAQPQDYEYNLSIPSSNPSETFVSETGSTFEVRRVAGADAGYNPDQLLDAESLPGPLRVRNWRPGDRFWPAHTKSPKKIKELLQERHVALPERSLWPVVVSGDEIVWLRGFPVPAEFQAKAGRGAIQILETLILEKPSAAKPAT
jgi:tRNA(Ile)-lysidine synthase